MALLGWVPGGGVPVSGGEPSASGAFLEDERQPRFVHNASGRFECRWATVRIEPSPSVLLRVRRRLFCALRGAAPILDHPENLIP